jgi:hypothetical protein
MGMRPVAAREARPEGMAWLGRPPEARASVRLRVVAAAGRLILRLVDLRIRVEGLDRPPAPGCIVACAMHRSWLDAPLLVACLPLQPRIWYLGSGEATFRSRSRAGWAGSCRSTAGA